MGKPRVVWGSTPPGSSPAAVAGRRSYEKAGSSRGLEQSASLSVRRAGNYWEELMNIGFDWIHYTAKQLRFIYEPVDDLPARISELLAAIDDDPKSVRPRRDLADQISGLAA